MKNTLFAILLLVPALRTYEFLFTDGTAHQYRVVGEGE
jgi:hypothetical protein